MNTPKKSAPSKDRTLTLGFERIARIFELLKAIDVFAK